MKTITVAIADPDREGLMACKRVLWHDLGITVVGEATSCKDLVVKVLRLKPHVLLFSLGLCTDAECSLLRALCRECPATRVVLLAEHSVQEDLLVHALAIGARGYLEHGVVERQLAKAVHGVNRGEAWVPRKMLGKIMEI
jgi:DNA-binding NarL/FixJ family response regulator